MRLIRFGIWWIWLAVVLGSVSVAEEQYEGEFVADLNHNGVPEMVQWNKFATADEGDYYQLRVIGDDGTVIWEGPEDENGENPLVPAVLDFGISIPELLVDYDMDGNMELLMPELQSDISPTIYRRLRWTEKGFIILKPAALVAKHGDEESFTWEEIPSENAIWISQFNSDGIQRSGGKIAVEMMKYSGDDRGRQAKAWIKFDRRGAHVVKWIKKFLKHDPVAKKGTLRKQTVWQKIHPEQLQGVTLEIPADWSVFRDEDAWEIKDQDGSVMTFFEIGLEAYDDRKRSEIIHEYTDACEKLNTGIEDSHGHEVFSLLCKAKKALNEQNIYAMGMQIFLTPSIGVLKDDIDRKLVLRIAMRDFSHMQSVIDHIVQSVHFAGEGRETSSKATKGKMTYMARLSRKDHMNSKGRILSTVRDILRQDRANLYKGGGEPEDTKESFFQTMKARSKMSRYMIVPIGRSYASMKKIILHGTPVVKIEVRPPKLYVEIVKE